MKGESEVVYSISNGDIADDREWPRSP